MRKIITILLLLAFSQIIEAQKVRLSSGETYSGEMENGYPNGYGTLNICKERYVANIRGIWEKDKITSWGILSLTLGDRSAFIDISETDNFSYNNITKLINEAVQNPNIDWDNSPITDSLSTIPKTEIGAFVTSIKSKVVDIASVLNKECTVAPGTIPPLLFELSDVRKSTIPKIKYELICKPINTSEAKYMIKIYTNNRRYMTIPWPCKIYIGAVLVDVSSVENPYAQYGIDIKTTQVLAFVETNFYYSEE